MTDVPVFGPATATVTRLRGPEEPTEESKGRKNYVINTDESGGAPKMILMSPKNKFSEEKWDRLKEGTTYEFTWKELGEFRNAWLETFKQIGVSPQPQAQAPAGQQQKLPLNPRPDRRDADIKAAHGRNVASRELPAGASDDERMAYARKVILQTQQLADEVYEAKMIEWKEAEAALEEAPAEGADGQATNGDDIPF